VLVVVCCWFCKSSDARAADADKVAARAHYETATRMYEVREYGEALKEYKAAYIAKPDPAFLFNIGQCYRKMGKDTEALDFFQQFLKKAPLDDPNRDLVEARIRNIRSGIASDMDPFDHSGRSSQRPREAAEASSALPSQPATAPMPPTAPAPAVMPSPIPEPAVPAAVASTPPVAPAPLPAAQPNAFDLNASAAPPNPSPPIYRRWWFWTGVGAVVVVGAVAIIAASSGGGGTTIPSATLGSRPVLP
jgi:hypothetical protein